MNSTIEAIHEVQGIFSTNIASFWKPLIVLAFYTAVLALYIIFVWKFYHFLAKRNILGINLNRYNLSEHPVFYKIWASGLFLLEYIILLPILVFFWLGALAVFLLFLSRSLPVAQVLLISTAIVAATRMASYYNEGAAQELAKIFPLTILATSISNPSFFSIKGLIGRFASIPSLFSQLLIYFVFIAGIEVLLRSIYIFIDFVTSEEFREVEEKTG